jgi:RIO-like serine/threonine protein kinase
MQLLKRDLFGTVTLVETETGDRIVLRDTREARWWLKWLARHLARREIRTLRQLEGLSSIPKLLHSNGHQLTREWIDGQPMQRARPHQPEYFRQALHLVRQLHIRRIVHNDLAKEPNWLVTPEGTPALVDFQLSMHAPRRGKLFRLLAYDDLRHLLKHKRSYVPEQLTARERRILANPSMVTRFWMATGKRVYLLVTRRLLGWADREGAGDRLHDSPR